jgi:hypothetical protein
MSSLFSFPARRPGAGDAARRRRLIWANGIVIPGRDPDEWRQDIFGYAMHYLAYGDRASEWGWEEDHVVPVTLGGTDHVSNIRPLHWRNNARLGGMASAGARR